MTPLPFHHLCAWALLALGTACASTPDRAAPTSQAEATAAPSTSDAYTLAGDVTVRGMEQGAA